MPIASFRFLFCVFVALASLFANVTVAQEAPDDELPHPTGLQQDEESVDDDQGESSSEVPLSEDRASSEEPPPLRDEPLETDSGEHTPTPTMKPEKEGQERTAPFLDDGVHDDKGAIEDEFDADAPAPSLPGPEHTEKTSWSSSVMAGGMIGCGVTGGISGAAAAMAYFFGGVMLASAFESNDSCGQACGLVLGYGFIVVAGGLLALLHGIVAPIGAIVGIALSSAFDDDSDRTSWMRAFWGLLPGIVGGLIAVAPLALLPFTSEFGSDALYPIIIGGVVTSAIGASIAATSGVVAILAAAAPSSLPDEVILEENVALKDDMRPKEATQKKLRTSSLAMAY